MKVIIFDTETTNVKDPEVIEVAWIDAEYPHESFEQRYKPINPITFGAMAVHSIMDEDLIDCLPSESFKLPEEVEYIIGHNIDFDWKAIRKPNVKRICTLALSRKLWPEIDSHTQSAVMYFLHRDIARDMVKNAHSALADVRVCYFILVSIKEKLGTRTWEELWVESEKARIPEFMPFGKHKGLPIGEVPRDYKAWLLRQDDVDEYLIKALKN